MARLRFIPIVVCLVAACSTTAPPVSKAGDEAAVRAAMNGFMDALNALDLDRMSAYFADNITSFVPLAQADRVEGREAVTRIFRNFVARTKPTTPRLNIVPEDMEVQVSGDLAFVSFNVREKSPDVTRRRTFIFVRSGERWLIRHAHASDFAGAPK
jgi:ketosteroid isomerase-like protein